MTGFAAKKRWAGFGGAMRALFAAVTLVAAFHLALLFLFKPCAQSNHKQRNQKRTVAMFSTDKDGANKTLAQWMEAGNPTLMAKPDSANGFSSLASPTRFKLHGSLANGLPLGGDGGDNGGAPGAFSGFKLEKTSPAGAALEKLERTSTAPRETPKAAPQKHPLIRTSDGIETRDPSLDDPSVREKAAKMAAGAKTVVKISRELGASQLMPRTRIESSCGSPELDKAAEKTALRSYLRLKLQSDSELQVEWSGGPEK